MGKSNNMRMSLRAQKIGLFLSVYVDDINMIGKKKNMDPMRKILQIETDLEDPTPFIDQVYLSCTQKEAKVDPRAVHSKNELFNKLRRTREADEKDQTKGKYSLEKITDWSYEYGRSCRNKR